MFSNLQLRDLIAGRKLKQALKEFGYELLEVERINKLLPFQAKILTLYCEPGDYLIMMLFFIGGLI
ncbi:hypothetical protein [Domibacillus iocasae]|uniref:Uncharacterized protein n=1 Tax=Domibacillus iocasae TaxID=1714016 RepID=A0A1E7DQX7_9BACI|nr:hypothetical protein [Domibacillus iocasae]OES45492.1 hypothetical protein BA724_01335 [Domibacillus iocasae]